MKAVRLHHRGGPEAVVVEEAPLPQPRLGEVRIRVHAAALTPNELTWDQTYRHPDGSDRLPTIPGHDVAGAIDALGPGVSSFAPGQPVYALIDFPFHGSAAEFTIAPANTIAPAPKSVDALHAAALPLSSLTAWQALFDHGQLTAGQRVLIHGGAGGVGAYAVQLAAWKKAHVIATASTAHLAAVKQLGAAHVIDYTRERFADLVRDADLVFDTVGGDTLSLSLSSGVLKRGGRLVSIAGMPDQSTAASQNITAQFFIVQPDSAQLRQIAELVNAGNITPRIQQIFPLKEARQAFERTLAGHLHGKVILQIP